MPESISLKLPLLVAEQAQKHVTHNEALRALDALVQLAVKDRDLTAPPGSPAEGSRYIVAASPTGVWAGHSADVAVWQDGAWDFHDPLEGWRCWVEDENVFLIFNGSAWVDWGAALGALQNLSLLGLGTTADATNPFSAKLNKALWTAKYAAEGGDGDLRYTMNKETSADTVSLLLQKAFSGRAEIGLIGDDDLTFKVSADGSTWALGLGLDRTTGGVRFLANQVDVASASTCDIGAAPSLKVRITGTTTITAFGSVAHAIKLIQFNGALTLTHNATSLILPGAANIVTADGDTAIATSDGSGNWRVRAYQRASGKPVISSTYGDVGVREKLTGDRTYYVRTDGSNSNTGLANTSGGAFLTIQKAWDTIVTLDLGGFTATIQLADGTYTAGLSATVPAVGGNVVINGNSGTPGNVIVSTTSATAITLSTRASVTVQNFELRTTTSGSGISVSAFGFVAIGVGMRFGACAANHIVCGSGRVEGFANYSIVGAASAHMNAAAGAVIFIGFQTVTITGTPAFSTAYAQAAEGGVVRSSGTTFSGSATGPRYSATLNAVIQSFGGGASYFPGNSAGSTATGGQYA